MNLDNIFKNLCTEDTDLNKTCSFISENIASGELTILNLLEKLDFLLTDTSSDRRELGINIVAEVLGKIPSDLLSTQQVEPVSTFFINKLKDHHMVIPSTIKGLVSLVQLKNYPSEHVPIMLTTTVDNISCQQQQQNDRYNIYRLFETLFENFSKELISMGLNFTYGIISSIDGERDPRNLLFLFKLMKKYLNIIPLGHLVEDMFDVFACYFPVDFKTPANNASISRESLAEALCPCLCAVPDFGEPCILLALEKLDSSLELAKHDSLELLREGCHNFSPQTFLDNSYKIWSQIQKEIFTSTNPKYQQQCLETLTQVVNKMSQGYIDQFKNFIRDSVDSLKGNLLPEMKQYEPSVLILLHIARGSTVSSTIVSSEIVPILANTFSIAPTKYRPKILKILVAFMTTYLTQNNSEEKRLLDTVLTLTFQSISDENEELRKEVFDTFTTLAVYLPKEIRIKLFNEISRNLIIPDCISVKVSFDTCLLELSKHYEDEIRKIILKDRDLDSLALDVYMSSVSKLATLETFRELILEICIKCMSKSAESSCVVVKNLKMLLQSEESNKELISAFIHKNFIGILLEFSVNNISNMNVREILHDVASVIEILIGDQDSATQDSIVRYWLTQLSESLEREESFVILINGIVTRLKREVEVDKDLTNKLFDVAVKSENNKIKETAVQLLGNVMNKVNIDDTFEDYLLFLKNKCEESNAFMAVSWITKALITRNYSEGLSWLSLLLTSLEENPQAAEGFRVLLNDSYDCFGTKSNCIKMPLHQQKVFGFVVKNILSRPSHDIKPQYLMAFGYLLESIPKEVVLLHFKQVSRLILLTLEHTDNVEILLTILKTVEGIISNNIDEIGEQLEDYIVRILKLTRFQNSMKVRIEALRFITDLLTTAPVYKLLPLRRAVLEQLGDCVDDKKRLVRKEAMQARSLWSLLDSPMD